MTNDYEFTKHRGRLFRLAYQMLGTVSDAEDVLQEAFLKWQHVEKAEVSSPVSYLRKMVANLCLEYLRSARKRREKYIGPWLPEPFVVSEQVLPPTKNLNPEELNEIASSLSMAFLHLLEDLSPIERATFVLREAFDFSYREIADVVGQKEDTCRQTARRAKQKLQGLSGERKVTERSEEAVFMDFMLACSTGDMSSLLKTLSEDVILYSDGGGKVVAARNPIVGPDKVARFLLGVSSKVPTDSTFLTVTVNGKSGVLVLEGEKAKSLLTYDVDGSLISRLFAINNPDKLQHIVFQA